MRGERVQADEIMRTAWDRYQIAYRAEMHESYRCRREDWERLLRETTVVLVCYCTDASRCHRSLLAGYLQKLGATVAGELTTEERKDHDRRTKSQRRAR